MLAPLLRAPFALDVETGQGLYSTFGPLVPGLWSLWERALLAKPVVIFAPSAELCSRAVLGVAGLVAPLRYCGDVRPYVTMFEGD